MSNERANWRANQLLAQLVPLHVLREAKKLAQQIEHEEKLKVYLLKHFWIILLAIFVLVALDGSCATVAFSFLRPHLDTQPSWVRSAALMTSALVWFCILLLQVYLLLSWFERRASKQGVFSNSRESNDSFPTFPWFLFVSFVAAPIGLLIVTWPIVMIAFILAPLIYTMFDE